MIFFLKFSLLLGLVSGLSYDLQAQKKKNNEPIVAPGSLSFVAESNLYKARASFKEWQFTKLSFPKNSTNLEGLKGNIEVYTNSVVERTIRVSNDLKTELYLDSKKYPKATAKILEVKRNKDEEEENKYTAKLELKIKNYKQIVYTNFEVTNDSPPYFIKGEINILKNDFQIGMDNSMGSIQNEVKILYETELKLSN